MQKDLVQAPTKETKTEEEKAVERVKNSPLDTFFSHRKVLDKDFLKELNEVYKECAIGPGSGPTIIL